ncbi:MAG TPA: hypothetical protein VK970_01250 [Candidatus Methylacidiphilales bacterium]|nr:hypothetical protein [Candidatus Methylacidiphilales bacterium]
MPSNKALAAEDIETIRKSVELRLDFTDEKGIYVLSDKTERKRLDAIKDWLILHVKVFQEHRAERNTMAIFYSAPAWDKVYQDNVSMSFALNGTSLDQPEIALKDLKKIVLDPALGPVPALSRGSIFKGLRPPLPMK